MQNEIDRKLANCAAMRIDDPVCRACINDVIIIDENTVLQCTKCD